MNRREGLPSLGKRRLVAMRHAVRSVVEALREARSTFRDARSALLRGRAGVHRQRRILVVDELLPDSRFGAGYPRAAELLHALVDAGWNVTMYPMIGSRADHETIRRRFARSPVRFVRSRGPDGLRRLMSGNLQGFDVTLISRPENMRIYSKILSSLPTFRTRCVYDAEAIFAARESRRLGLFGHPMTETEYERALDREIALVGDADALITVTEAEAMLFRARSAKPVHVIKHSIVIRGDPAGFEGRTDLLFVGRCAGARELSPNVDSLHWFVREVMPLIDAMMAVDHRLVIAGLADEDIVSALGSDRVVFMGVVDDLATVYDRCRVFVAPTRFSAGIPLKVVEAAAAGIPCVVTELLATQLEFRDRVELLVGRDAVGFARSCVALYEDSEQWTRVRDAARDRVAEEYSRAKFGDAVRDALGVRAGPAHRAS